MARPLAEDEVDFDSGFLMVPSAVPEAPPVPTTGIPGEGPEVPPTGPEPPTPPTGPGAGPASADTGTDRLKRISLVFKATRDQVFKAFPAIANLADRSDDERVKIRIEGTAADGYDPSWLRNAVEEPLDEADIDLLSDDECE
ncbi:MAG: hypothetical protein JRH18_23495 [Deltaproteobacteria bacterium]|nr:hypothetical protein [Deltaproteobacteria bacterium]